MWISPIKHLPDNGTLLFQFLIVTKKSLKEFQIYNIASVRAKEICLEPSHEHLKVSKVA